MLHERVSEIDVTAAAWPTHFEYLVQAERMAPPRDILVQAQNTGSAPAAPDIPVGVGRLIVGAYAGLIAAFFLLFTGSATALMAVTISAIFVAIFFTVPRIFLAVEPATDRRPTLGAFMDDGIETWTGHCSGRDALVQMLIVPVLLMLGVLTIGVIASGL